MLEPKSQCLCDACDACWKSALFFGVKSQVNKQIRGGCDIEMEKEVVCLDTLHQREQV